MFLAYDHPTRPHSAMPGEQMTLVHALNSYAKDDLAGAWKNWRLLGRQPRNPIELTMVAECLADQGDEAALGYIDQLQATGPTEAKAIRARLLWRQDRKEEASNAGRRHCFPAGHPWPMQALITRTINLAVDLVEADKTGASGAAMDHALQKPFAVYNSEEVRMFALSRRHQS